MSMPTREQRVRILVHHAWDLRDAGTDDQSIIRHIIDEGVPADIARTIPGLIDDEIPKLRHDDSARQAIVQAVQLAVDSQDSEALREALLQGVVDERTLHKMYEKLSQLLTSESHEKGTLAAFGLSWLPGKGDWPLIEALSHQDENVRFRAAFALGKMGKDAVNALGPLQEMAKSDPDDLARETATEAVATIEKETKPRWKFW
jgi:HEAT repeat protein